MKKVFGLLKKVALGFVVLVVIAAVFGGGSGSSSSRSSSQASTSQPAEEAAPVEYQTVSMEELMGALKNNPMNAKNTYEGMNVRITGSLSNIDASGKYFSIDDGSEWTFDSIRCDMNDDATRSRIASASMKDQLTVCGKIKSVGEIMGYAMDVDYIE